MKLLYIALTLILLASTSMAQVPQSCSVTKISTVSEWQKANPKLPFKGTANTKLVITMRCPDKGKLVDLPDDLWAAYGRSEALLNIDGMMADPYFHMLATGDIPSFTTLIPFSAIVSQNVGPPYLGYPDGVMRIRLPASVFIRWLQGDIDAEVRSFVFYALTGCPWGRPGEIDARQCVSIK